jgi:TolB-like protein/Tfp pilus assembly protein PilF
LNAEHSVFHELWRRKVHKVVAAYLAGSWFLLKMGEVVVETLGLPGWTYRTLVLVVICGFPLSAIFAWLFEITPEGIKLQSEVDRRELPQRSGHVLTYFILGSIILAGVISVRTFLTTGSSQPPSEADSISMNAASIAVLPFSNTSTEADNQYFADGLTEELMTLLAAVPELRVAGRTSSFSFKGAQDDLTRIGDALNVGSVLEGSVRKSGDNLRVNAQLVDTKDGFEVWSQTYDRKMGDIFDLQTEIATKVVDTLKIEILGLELESPGAEFKVDPAAFDAYLLGKYHFRQRGEADISAAIESYQKALAIDPLYAAAHAALGAAHFERALRGYVAQKDGFAAAELQCKRALALRPDLAEGHYQLGMILLFRDWDWQGADRFFDRAIEIDPNHLGAVQGASSIAMHLGRLEESVELAQRVADADPLSLAANYNLGVRLYQAGRLDRAQATLEDTLQFNPDAPVVRALMAKVLVAKGEPDRALDAALQEPAAIWQLAVLPIVYNALGRGEDAERSLARLVEEYSESAAFQIAEAYASMDRTDDALLWLEKAYELRDAGMVDLISQPSLADLRHHPRFDSLREKMGLPEASS